ncbi:DUF632 domain-containing protein/DUF630 domain-containing protein [Cephalotus follicularis]|uniref:DUF632 domain-containing protein/DUF630 domain-containing protein n=1 Tax=Cephalotus follicularis TaxID=3775 RepID=A0A1Q3B2V7_CEPFO|nr:DUF632 domain-containing protein/DUF630 domain-containing protein [Cephalotus follicularis]
MGCVASKKDEEGDVVTLCKQRKRLMKLAVERRYAFADAHCKYNQSLYAVAAALRLFVARHSSPSSPFLVTFPSTSNDEPSESTIVTNPMFLQQRPTEPTHQAIAFEDSKICINSSNVETEIQELNHEKQNNTNDGTGDDKDEKSEEEESEDEEVVCENFYGKGTPTMPSPRTEFGWDFFDSFKGINEFSHSDEDLKVVREQEGIPDLEEVGERSMSEGKAVNVNIGQVCHEESGFQDVKIGDDANNVSHRESSRFVIDEPTNGRELLEALKDVEDHFVRAYDSGLDVSKMLETNRVLLQSGLEEMKENSNSLIRSITLNRSTSSGSSFCKSLLTSSSKSSSTWTEFTHDLFDDFRGMEAGSHSSTLGRLYAWEKKLYEEVKAGDRTRRNYERKRSQLRNQDARVDGLHPVDKMRAEIKNLHTRILVAVRSAESISEKIEKMRDEELHPQLVELLHGLMRNWKIMLESHETQNRIMFEVTSFNCPSYGKFCNDFHRLATLQLEAELHNWRACFAEYVSTQKAYIEALDGWLKKFIAPEVELYSNTRPSIPPCRVNGPPLLVLCHNWLACIEKLPDKSVTCAMKSFGKDIRALWVQQGQEQQQKRKVDGLAKELDGKEMEFRRVESRILAPKISEHESDINFRNQIEYLADRKNQLDMFRKRLDAEKENHISSMEETQQITVNGFQTGFCSIFEFLAKFSKASVKMYADLMSSRENADAAEERGNESFRIEELNYHLTS